MTRRYDPAAMIRRQGPQPRDPRPPAADAERRWVDEVVIWSSEDAPAGFPTATSGPLPRLVPARLVPAWLVAVALLLAGSAVAGAAVWWQHRSRVIEVTHVVRPYTPAGPDPTGCPSGSHCEVRPDLGEPLNVLARELFPAATVLSSVSVVRPETGRTVQTTIVLRDPSGIEVSATAQCVPGAAPIPLRVAPLPAVGPAQADFVVSGVPGCSVAVAAQIPRAVPVPVMQLQQLAADPQVQLSP